MPALDLGPCNALAAVHVKSSMGCFRALLCLLLPPVAVLDKGCGAFLVTFILTLIGWVPGVIAAILFCTRETT
jgi:uncharacterized membrane protein YqaE (UPF0057 family)